MQIPEIDAALKELDRLDNKCKDALIAKWNESNPVAKAALEKIYEKYDKKRSDLIKRLEKLTNG